MNITLWRQLTGLAPRTGRRLGAIAVCSVVGGVLEAVVLVIMVGIATNLGQRAPEISIGFVELSELSWLALAATALLTLAVVHGAFSHLVSQASARTLHAARSGLFEAFYNARHDARAQDVDGKLQHAVSTLSEQSSHLTTLVAMALAAAMNISVLISVSAIVNPLATVAVFGIGLLVFGCLRPLTRAARSRSQQFVADNKAVAEETALDSRMFLEVTVLGVESERAEILEHASSRAATSIRRARLAGLGGTYLFRDVAMLLVVAGLAALLARSDADLASTGAVLLLIVRAVSYAQALQNARQAITEYSPNLDSLVETIDGYRQAARIDGGKPVLAATPLQLESVHYRYPGQDVDTLVEANLEVAPGQAIGLSGPSGSGKSTLIELILGVREPTSGTVLAAGTAVTELSRKQWSRSIGFVPQDVNLIDATVEENVRFFRDDVSPEDVAAALKSADLLSVVDRLPSGVHTRLGRAGAGLSGGQKQRLAIARALAGGPDLLIMDEPTSALDAGAESEIAETIRRLKGDISILVVAHRPETLAACDEILEVRDGRIHPAAPTDDI